MRDRSKLHPKVSVVIPMYNCEQFVPDLLKMFSEQSFTDFEVVCVIDGATDGTEEAVKEYCKTDDRFRYVVRENGGAGAARNTGIDEAKGKYVIFSDADDIYDKDYLLKLYNSAESLNTDITVCGNIIFDHQTGEIRQVKSFDKECMFEGEVYSSKRIKRIFTKIGVHISNKLFRLDFIKKNALKFSETKTSNDLFFSKASVICAGRISVVHDDLLTIRRHINERSISSNRTSNSINALTELQKLYNWMEEKDLLGVFISDYMWLFDVTVNYEMKNGLNPDFIEKFVKNINCDRPWIYLKGEQISIVLNNCLGKNGNEEIKKVEKDIRVDEKERLQKFNEVSEFRNNNKKRMQEMAKDASVRLFNRNLADPESESPYKKRNGETEIQHISDNSKFSGETKNPEISVIIPMYNCEVFVNDCLDMFSNQTFRDFEVICVIDGATDKTEEKVKDYSKKDPRISYICQTNGGAGSARNTGLDRAKGRYIIFADADDEYSEDYLKKLYENAINHDAQVVVCSFDRCDINLQNDMKEMGFSKKRYFENIIYSHRGVDDLFNAIQSRITNRLYNTRFVKENNLRFSETRISNDTFFGCASLSIADRILFVHDSLLTYRLHINADSLTDKRVRFLHEAIIVLKELYNWLKDRSLMDIHGEDYYRRTDHVLCLDGARGATPRFISDFAYMLNAEEPWDRMTSGEILKFLERSIFAEDDIRKEAVISRLSPELTESDAELGLIYDECKKRIHTAKLLRQVSLERYGRDFDCNDSLPGS